ncbi:hypothetical protein [uncultured Azohydromonas sp.]|uniref:hypothetical protein n=1 Tax=uncultured Azohydromonas sp. TaxID=487342 RepID=UPI00261068AD|nr:hypothetical protein [uncultured Azohydromonas sp.]
MTAPRRRIAAVVVLAAALPAPAAAMQHAFLVQNSGWMEPFYADPASPFKALVAAVAQAAVEPQDTVYTLAFSQSSAGNESPRLLSKAQGAGEVARHLGALQVARKGAGPALADTDFQEAITKTITGPLGAAPGVLWIFTNNRNSPGNDPRTAERNRDFYRLLHLEPSITRTLAFPLSMPVQGRLYSARGLMVYALAYGQSASQALENILAKGALSRVLTQAPARLKPLDQEAVRIVPEAVANARQLRASLGSDQRTIVLDAQSGDLRPEVVLRASLQNLFYPYAIREAEVQARLDAAGQQLPVQVSPARVQALQPGARQPVEVRLALPMAQVPSAWSTQALAAMGKQVLLPMTVEIGLSGQRLEVAPAFAGQMAALFPGDPLPEVFTPPESARASRARVPLLLRVQYPLAPVLALLGGVLALVAGGAGLAVAASRSRRYELDVDGLRRAVVLKRFGRLAVRDPEGQVVGEVRRGWGRPRVVSTAQGHTLAFTGR